jgi:hypothetical protein
MNGGSEPETAPGGGAKIGSPAQIAIAAALAVLVGVGVYAYRGGFSQAEIVAANDKSDPDMATWCSARRTLPTRSWNMPR